MTEGKISTTEKTERDLWNCTDVSQEINWFFFSFFDSFQFRYNALYYTLLASIQLSKKNVTNSYASPTFDCIHLMKSNDKVHSLRTDRHIDRRNKQQQNQSQISTTLNGRWIDVHAGTFHSPINCRHAHAHVRPHRRMVGLWSGFIAKCILKTKWVCVQEIKSQEHHFWWNFVQFRRSEQLT